MKILRNLRLGVRSQRETPAEFRAKLPEVNAFVEIAIDGSRRSKSIPIDDITSSAVITRRFAELYPGADAEFFYTNSAGRFHFATVCFNIEAEVAAFRSPTSIDTIESFDNRRRAARVPLLVPVQWRYAPDGRGYGDFVPASLIDLSRRGASIVVNRQLKVSAQVEVRLTLKANLAPLVAVCEVVRSTKIETSDKTAAKNTAGIRFQELDLEEERILDAFVTEQQMLRRERGVV